MNRTSTVSYVVDVPKFATLVQFDPPLELQVKAIDDEQAGQILQERPELGLDMQALRSRVALRLYQSYAFDVRDQHAVWSAKLSAF